MRGDGGRGAHVCAHGDPARVLPRVLGAPHGARPPKLSAARGDNRRARPEGAHFKPHSTFTLRPLRSPSNCALGRHRNGRSSCRHHGSPGLAWLCDPWIIVGGSGTLAWGACVPWSVLQVWMLLYKLQCGRYNQVLYYAGVAVFFLLLPMQQLICNT